MKQIIYDLPDDAYHADNISGVEGITISRSLLWALHQGESLRDIWDKHPRLGGVKGEDKPAWEEGRLWHRYLAGEDMRVVLIHVDSYHTKDSRRQRDQARADGLTPMLAKDYAEWLDGVRTGAKELHQSGLYDPEAKREVTYIAELEGVPLRVRADSVVEHADGIDVVDYKTTTDLTERKIERAVSSYGYAFQQAVYCAVIEAATGIRPDFSFAFIRKDPITIREVSLADDYVEAVYRSQVIPVLAKIRAAIESGDWPDYEPLTLEKPNWISEVDPETESEIGKHF
jgi:hypothetical protein